MRRKNVILIVALVIFAAWGAIELKPALDAQDNQKQISRPEYNKSASDNPTPIVRPSGPPSVSVAPSETSASGSGRYHLWAMAWLAWVRSWVAHVIDEPPNFFAFMVAVFTYYLWDATAGLREVTADLVNFAEEQSRDMKASIAIAKESADAAVESNKISRNLFITENRPWLILEINGWSPLIWEEKGARFSIDVTITNAGRSPATNVWFEAVAFSSGAANPASVETVRTYCDKRSTSRDSVIDNGIIVVPGHPYRTGFNLMLFRDEIDKNISMGEDWFSLAIKTCIAIDLPLTKIQNMQAACILA